MKVNKDLLSWASWAFWSILHPWLPRSTHPSLFKITFKSNAWAGQRAISRGQRLGYSSLWSSRLYSSVHSTEIPMNAAREADCQNLPPGRPTCSSLCQRHSTGKDCTWAGQSPSPRDTWPECWSDSLTPSQKGIAAAVLQSFPEVHRFIMVTCLWSPLGGGLVFPQRLAISYDELQKLWKVPDLLNIPITNVTALISWVTAQKNNEQADWQPSGFTYETNVWLAFSSQSW